MRRRADAPRASRGTGRARSPRSGSRLGNISGEVLTAVNSRSTQFLLTMLVVVAVAFGAVGPALAQSDEPVTIRYWQYFFETKVELIDELIAEFEAENPGIKVIHEDFPYEAYEPKVATAIPAGEGPEIANLFYGWLPAWVNAGYLEPLPMSAEEIESEFIPMVKGASMNGQYYG